MNTNKIWEILIYELKKGTGNKFHKIMTEESVPLHQRKEMTIISYGQSLHDPDSYSLIREYDSLKHLEESQEKFYSDPEWLEGPREKIIQLIKTSSKFVIPKGLKIQE